MSTDRNRVHESLAPASEVLIRLAGPRDGIVLERLAALDSQPPLDDEPTLIAAVDGVTVAALSLRSGRVVADPFSPTAAVCDLLRFRATSIAMPKRAAKPFGRLLRLASAA